MNEKTYYLVLTEKNGDYIILESEECKEIIEDILVWYMRHQQFFNGTFSIEESE